MPTKRAVIETRDYVFIEDDTAIPKIADPSDPGPPCAVCGTKDEIYPSRIILCDCPGCEKCIKLPDGNPGCNRAYHLACLTPPLHRLPVGDWCCPECRSTSPAGVNNNIVADAPPPEPTLMYAPTLDASDPTNPSYVFEPRLTSPSPPVVMRGSGRISKPPQRLVFMIDAPATNASNPNYPPDPVTLEEALHSPDCEDWIKATNNEISSLLENGTFNVVDTPPGIKPIGSKWVFKKKYDAFGFLLKYKVRLVAKGFLQRFGLDYGEVFSPVSKTSTLRLILSHAAANNLPLKQIDVATAFLNGDLEETVYVQIPPGLAHTYPSKCFKLNKAIYGLKQAPRVWYLNLTNTLITHGFTPSFADACLFYRQGKHGIVVMLVYVDDILVTGHDADVDEALKIITHTYKCSEPEHARSFLGMALTRDHLAGTITLSQTNYIEEAARKHGFDLNVTYRVNVPMPDVKPDFDAGAPLPPNNEYASLVGSLLYLANCTRPDISFSVNSLARHLRNPCEKHMGLAKQVLRYALTTKHTGLVYGKPTDPQHSLTLVGYSDSDYANFSLPEPNEKITRRSVTGFVFLSNGTPIAWQSRKQVTVSRSSDEAEYQAMATAASQALWLRKLLAEIDSPARKIEIFCDNAAALTHVHAPGSINKTKHVDVQHQFILDRKTRGDLDFTYIPSAENLADIFTKPLTKIPFEKLKNKLFKLCPIRGSNHQQRETNH